MVDSTTDIRSKHKTDVTPQIISYAQLYGGSDNTNQSATASSRTMQYAVGSTVQKPVQVPVKTVPQVMHLQNPAGVGLFGSEMVVVRFDLDIRDSGRLDNCGPMDFEGYFPACLHLTDEGTINTYEQVLIDQRLDLGTVNTYEPARLSNGAITGWQPMVNVRLDKLSTGNQYQDCWVDATFLNHNRTAMAETEFWTPIKSTFYLSIAARNTRRLPYNLKVTIGQQVQSLQHLSPQERTQANGVS